MINSFEVALGLLPLQALISHRWTQTVNQSIAILDHHSADDNDGDKLSFKFYFNNMHYYIDIIGDLLTYYQIVNIMVIKYYLVIT